MEKNTVTENVRCDYGGGVIGGNVLCNLRSGHQWQSSPPPFLMKTFDVVDDLKTNSIISWNSSGSSFIIWDHIKFSAEVLPRHFKTSNFSSFVYQLNNYGFKKISWERYEYANGWFQAGKKHWLKNIKRRNQQSQVTRKRKSFTPDHNLTNTTMERKIYAMMTEQNEMKWTIQKLRQSLETMEDQLAILETKSRLPEFKGEKMKIAVFLKQFMQYLSTKKDEESGDNSKRPRLDSTGITELAVKPADKVGTPTQKIFSSAAAAAAAADDDDSGSSIQDQENKTTENAKNCQFWKNMLEDEAGFKSNGEQGDLATHHSKAIMELDEMMASNIAMQREILITKPSDPDAEDDGQLELWT